MAYDTVCDPGCSEDPGDGGGGGGTNQPPTISRTFNCSVPGWGDWCIGSLSIELTASDPQNASLIISGDVNGNPSTGSGQVFTCTENPCTIDLSEGAGTINYKVDASTGLSDRDSTAYYVDVTTPQIDGSISGTSGTNNWFTTQTLVTASASDFNSGIASLEVNVNNTGYNPYADTTFMDGIHTIQFRAYDNAGNVTETAIQTIMVDTVTPSLSLQVDGTRGQNDFYTNSVTVTPIASDSGSGINKIEASVDNGIWTVINSPLFFADGNHSYQIRVTDNAGNVTETPVQTLYIDASPAVIAMLDDSLILGDGLFYSIEDSQSGLSELRVVIKDNQGKYKSITWVENLDRANKYKDSVWWDGIFPSNTLGTGSDGTYPTPGIYFIALKVINGAGVETIRTATIEVPVVKTAEQENLPALVLPALVEPVETAPQAVQPSAPQVFGNSNNPFTGNSIQTSFSIGSQSTALPNTNTTSNVLWGGAAAAMLGATLAEWQKRREEEAARLAALRNSGGGEEGDSDAAAKKRAKVMAKNQAKRAQEQAWEAARVTQKTKATQNKTAKDNNLNKAEAVMNAVKPVTPYVVSSYLDKEEETWLKENESQRAWAAVDAREEAKKDLPKNTKIITVSGGLFGPPSPEVSQQELEDDPPGLPGDDPIIKTRVEAIGMGVDLLAYLVYYEAPKQWSEYSGSVSFSPFDDWNPTPAPVPYKNPSPSELWWIINGVQIKNLTYEKIFVEKVEVAINSEELDDWAEIYPKFSPLNKYSDYNLITPDSASEMFEIDQNNLVPPNGEAHIRIRVTSETLRFGVLTIHIKP